MLVKETAEELLKRIDDTPIEGRRTTVVLTMTEWAILRMLLKEYIYGKADDNKAERE